MREKVEVTWTVEILHPLAKLGWGLHGLIMKIISSCYAEDLPIPVCLDVLESNKLPILPVCKMRGWSRSLRRFPLV